MWLMFAFGSAIFAGITAILAKCGIRDVDSDAATAVRTGVVLVFAWLMVFVTGAQGGIGQISSRTLLFLVLSGLATGGSWLCYFKALQLGDVNRVAPVDKSSTVLTMVLAFIVLGEPVSARSFVGLCGIGIGTWLMIQKKEAAAVPDGSAKVESEELGNEAEADGAAERGTGRWLLYALLSAVFASLTSILGKIGIQGIDSNLGTAIRTIVVLGMAWLVVFVKGKQGEVKHIGGRSLGFLCLSGITTGASWLCYYRALQDGLASVVVPVDKLSIVLTVAFSRIFLKERLSRRGFVGLLLIVAGTLMLL